MISLSHFLHCISLSHIITICEILSTDGGLITLFVGDTFYIFSSKSGDHGDGAQINI